MFDHLISIHPEPGRPILAVHPDQVEAVNSDGFGIYFSVNTVRPGLTTKATKRDITSVRFAHVDIDPPKTGPWDKSAVLAALMAQGPSVVIDSGNGLQGMWALTPGATVEQVETINKGLIQRFNADKGTWNVDRVFRMPGTINWPNALKIAAGRVPVLSELVHQSPTVYDPATLLAHFPYVAPAKERGTGEIEIADFEIIDLPARASTTTYDLVHRPLGQDRSVDVSRAVTAMARDGMTDAEIMGVILNPALPISGHCLDQKDPERAARRKCSLAADHRFDAESAFPDDSPVLPAAALPEPPARTKARLGGFGLRTHTPFLSISDQMDLFEGCTYIVQSDKVLMPDGMEVGQSRFDVVRGGHMYSMDDVNETKTKSAWEAFLKNSAYRPPTAHATCFRPELEPFALVRDGTWDLVNTYQPIDTPRKEGDPGPFLEHLKTLFPNERDRAILISYMASLIQNPGVKFQWWPVIQGAKGNGKTLLLNIMTFCVGEQYSHLPNTSKMTRNGISFNGWLKGKLFLGMDEVYSAQRRDFLEEFKPYVTNRRLPIESKGVDEYTGDNRANGLMLTNHKDGVPVDKDERRYAVFFTKQQTAEECFMDGLTPGHFQKLWAWLDADGFAIINDYLRTFKPIPEFDPAGLASRAPRTSSTDEAIVASRGRVETEILEAIEDARPGFRGGYISSAMVVRLLEEKRLKLPLSKFKETLDHLGYEPHPGLPESRTPGKVLPDMARTRLYVLKDAPRVGQSSTDIATDYEEKQEGP